MDQYGCVPAQDVIDFPPSWLAVLHPRRGGRPVAPYMFTEAQQAQLEHQLANYAGEREEILRHPRSDPQLVEAARSNDSSVTTVATRLALYCRNVYGSYQMTLAEDAVRELGLTDAVVACLESMSICAPFDLYVEDRDGTRVIRPRALVRVAELGRVLSNPTAPEGIQEREHDTFRTWVPYDLLKPLRVRLAGADGATSQEVIARIEPYRHVLWSQRWAASYLFPERHDWVREDLAAVGQISPYVAFEPRQVGYFTGLDAAVTLVDAMEHAATPVLIRALDDAYAWSEHARQTLIGVLARIPSDDAVRALLERIDLGADVAAGFADAAAADPSRAARVLVTGADLPGAAALIARTRATHPELYERPAAGPSEAPDSAVPAALATPPWQRPRPAPIIVPAPDPSPRIEWLDGERARWAHWGPYEVDPRYNDPSDDPDFYLFGPDDNVRPLLANWAADKAGFYLRSPFLLVHRFELDAYAPALRIARAKPALGARLLMPYISADVAATMAGWLVGSRRFAAIAREWFDRHGAAAAAQLLQPAGDASTADAQTAARALAKLDPSVVRAAGRELGAEDEVERILARDPLDLLTGKKVRLPGWLELDELPPVRTRDGAHVLARQHVTTLLQLLAQSRLDAPHPAVRDTIEGLHRGDAAHFAWSLYGAWLLAGRPAKDAWAFDALGAQGDDAVVQRLAPRIRIWPTLGAAQRAKRGAEVLGAIDSTVALRHLSVIARTAKSTPLRKHASEVLDRAAAGRGLLPEQLEDLVAPAAGLDEAFTYQGTEYRPRLNRALAVELATADAQPVSSLPRPVSADDEAIVAGWKRTQREAKRDIAAQRARLEQAMITQRAWARQEFETFVLGHPLLAELARGLVWTLDERLVAIDALGDLVGRDGGLVTADGWIRIAHPASADLTPWREWLARSGRTAPFSQLDREVFTDDPSLYWNTVVSAASLHSLVRLGWRWDQTQHAAMRRGLSRPLNGNTAVILMIEPGVSAVLDPRDEPDQRIETLTLHSGEHTELSVFADLPRATRSELARELSHLERRGPPQ